MAAGGGAPLPTRSSRAGAGDAASGHAGGLGLLAAAGSTGWRPTEGGQEGPPWSAQRPARQRHQHNARAPACSPPGRLKGQEEDASCMGFNIAS